MPLTTSTPQSQLPPPAHEPQTDIIILGSGIIGLCTAFYLSDSSSHTSRSPASSITLIDSSPRLFHCASGFAGGFLAEDWFPPSTAELGALSFRLHRELARNHQGGAAWGYAGSTAWSLTHDGDAAGGENDEDGLAEGGSESAAAAEVGKEKSEHRIGPKWLKRVRGSAVECISRGGTTAQVDPKRLCKWLLSRCQERGVRVVHPARAVDVVRSVEGVLKGVRIVSDGVERQLPCTHLAITSGPWTPRVFNTLFPHSKLRIPISPLAGHSLLVKNPQPSPPIPESAEEEEPCHAIFATQTDALDFSPEWFARAGGELYLAGLNSTEIPLPEVATDAKPDEHAIEKLRACARIMIRSVGGTELDVLSEGLCFRPITPSGRPIISRIPDTQLESPRTSIASHGGVFVAAGHGPWGISLGPGTGYVLAELMQGRKPSVQTAALGLPGL